MQICFYPQKVLRKKILKTAKKLVSSAEKAGKYSAETLQNAAILYMKMSMFDKGIELVDRAIEFKAVL